MEADWAALEAAKGQPTTTTQAAKQRAARLAAAAGGTPGATTQLRNAVTSELKRPPTTPQVTGRAFLHVYSLNLACAYW